MKRNKRYVTINRIQGEFGPLRPIGMPQFPSLRKWFEKHAKPHIWATREYYGSVAKGKNGNWKLETSKKKSAAAWNLLSKEYVKVKGIEATQLELNYVLQQMKFTPGMNVLSLYCGPGLIENYLAYYLLKKGKIFGVDSSQAMIAKANTVKEKNKLGNVEFVCADAKSIPIRDDTQHAVLMIGTPINWRLLAPAISEAHRAIKKEESSRLVLTSTVDSIAEGDTFIKKFEQESNFKIVHSQIRQGKKQSGEILDSILFLSAKPK